MNARIASRLLVVVASVCVASTTGRHSLLAQSTTSASQRARPRIHLKPGDRPNRATEADLAAGQLVDSLFQPLPPAGPLPRANSRSARTGTPAAAPKTAWKGRLVHNPKTDDGRPPYVIIDRYGGVKRYVEPSEKVDLDRYVGRYVTVRRDTGDTLLVSQLLLPKLDRSDAHVRMAAHEETLPEGELVPVPEAESAPLPTADEPMAIDDGLDFGESHAGPYADVYEGEVYDGQVHNGPVFEDGVFQDGQVFEDGQVYDDGLHFAGDGCPTCGSAVCAKSPCGFGSRPILYFRAQYLLWWLDGMNTPPLVIQDAVDDTFQNATIIYGGNKVLEQVRNGGRVSLGYWLDDYGKWAVEGDYLGLETLGERFVAGSKDGLIPNISIGRPFINGFDFDANGDGDVLDPGDVPRGRAVEEVDTTNLDGSVTVDVESRFQSAGVRLRRGLCCSAGCSLCCGDGVDCGTGVGCGAAGGCGFGIGPGMGVRRIDALFGVRWAQLDEGLRVTEDLATRDTVPTTFFLQDQFLTSNEFVGADLGFIWEWEHQRWSLELLSKLALGSTRQRVRIAGSTQSNAGPDAPGGLLALPSNIGPGVYTRDQFSVMPELGATIGYLLTDRLRLTAGYTFLYWSNVVRPGDQIDNVLDITQVPIFGGNANAGATAVQPRFGFRETGLWAQGVSFGVDYRW